MHTYEFMNYGTCLGDLVPNGSMLDVDTGAEINLGNIVAIVLKNDGAFHGFSHALGGQDLLGVTKIFLGCDESSTGETVYLVGQLNPPTISPIPEGAIAAMHLVTGGQVPEGMTGQMNQYDELAMSLLGPFFRGKGPYPSINPQWQPPE